jgi:carboxylesterase type B
MIEYWTRFAAQGNPSSAGLAVWPPYREASPEAQELGIHIGPVPVPRTNAMRAFMKIVQEEAQSHPAN